MKLFSWSAVERFFFILLVSTHAFLFGVRVGIESGWDSGPFLGHMGALTWTNFLPAIDSGFYAYHPPLGFLLTRTVHLLGFSPIVAGQIVSFTCSVLAFLALRQALHLLKLRDTPLGIGLLYGMFSLPLLLSLATSLNLDSFLLLLTSVMLLACVYGFLSKETSEEKRLRVGVLIAAIIAAGMFIKFSALLLCAIPVVVALASPRIVANLKVAAMGILAAGLVVFPFYYLHYYTAAGTFFPHNADLLQEYRPKAEEVRMVRDADRLGFLWNLVTPAGDMEGPGDRDYENMRVTDTWRDIWSADTVVLPMTARTATVAGMYLVVMPFVFLLGLAGCAWRLWRRPKTDEEHAWRTLGIILLSLGAIHLLALLYFLYQTPIADWRSGKAIYVAPAMPALVFVLVHAVVPFERLLKKLKRHPLPLHVAFLTLVGIFLVINHVIPVY